MSTIDPKYFDERLEELGKLKDGWWNGEGNALDAEGLKWLKSVIHNYCTVPPLIFPEYGGNVLFEWLTEDNNASLEVNLKKHTGAWNNLNLKTNLDCNRDLDLNNTKDWEWIIEQLKLIGIYENKLFPLS